MGSDSFEVQEEPLNLHSVKVHSGMCKELARLVDSISSVLPQIEAARPGGAVGIQTLCLLQKTNERARQHLRNCCDSSKLYLAITGDAIVKRFVKTRNLFVQSLSRLQGMVPVSLASQISDVLIDLQGAVFFMDSHEELAGKVLRALLDGSASPINSIGNSMLELVQFAAAVLHVSSQKDILLEQRSLKKMLRETKEGDSTKREALSCLICILKNYNKNILQGQPRDHWIQNGRPSFPLKSDNKSMTAMRPMSPDITVCTDYGQDRTWSHDLHRPDPPEEYICHLSSTLMRDPVTISSGHTFERASIQKWFDEGHVTCPKSYMKLPNLSVIPNNSMKDMILKWSVEHKVIDPSLATSEVSSLDISSNSLCSAASSLKGLHLRVDFSSTSLGSFDCSYNSFCHSDLGDGFYFDNEASDVGARKLQFYQSNDDIKSEFLFSVNRLPWESQCRAIQDVHNYLVYYNPSCSFVSSENFLEPLLQFLQHALDKQDVEAQKSGIQLLLTFLRASRTDKSQLDSGVFALLASFLATDTSLETLAIVEVMSTETSAISRFNVSGVLSAIIKLLVGHDRDILQAAIRILYNLSLNISVSSCTLASEWIPKLAPLLEYGSVAATCIGILENLSKYEETRVAITKTEGCIASIIELLQSDCSEATQEKAVGILLSLCAQRTSYCHLVLHEGGIPALVHVSNNGNDKGKIKASELLRLLKVLEYEPEQECPEQEIPEVEVNASEDHPQNSDRKPTKTSRSLRWPFSKKK